VKASEPEFELEQRLVGHGRLHGKTRWKSSKTFFPFVTDAAKYRVYDPLNPFKPSLTFPISVRSLPSKCGTTVDLLF
jgi:hypothetical protein